MSCESAVEKYMSAEEFTCCIPGCPTGNNEESVNDAGLYPLPPRSNAYHAWVTRIKSIYPDWQPRPMSRICGLHFSEKRPSENIENNDYCPTIFPIPIVHDKPAGGGSMVFIQPYHQEACNGCSCCIAKEAKIKELNTALLKCREMNKVLAGETTKAKTDVQLLRERLRTFEGKAEVAGKFCSTEHVLNVNINMLRKQLNQEQAKVVELEQKLAVKVVEVIDLKKEMTKQQQKELKEFKFEQKKLHELETERKHAVQYKAEVETLKEQKKLMKSEMSNLKETVKMQQERIKKLEAMGEQQTIEDLRMPRKKVKKEKLPASGVKSLLQRGITLEKIEEPPSPTEVYKTPRTRAMARRKSKSKAVHTTDSDEELLDEGTLSQIVMSKIHGSKQDDESEFQVVQVKEGNDNDELSDGSDGFIFSDN